MTKQEFESMAIRGNETISTMLYEKIERYYMSDNNYHEAHGGIDETKQDFVKRVFGGKVNTAKTILQKITAESIKENRWALRGNPSATKYELDRMDRLITEHTQWLSKMN